MLMDSASGLVSLCCSAADATGVDTNQMPLRLAVLSAVLHRPAHELLNVHDMQTELWSAAASLRGGVLGGMQPAGL